MYLRNYGFKILLSHCPSGEAGVEEYYYQLYVIFLDATLCFIEMRDGFRSLGRMFFIDVWVECFLLMFGDGHRSIDTSTYCLYNVIATYVII